MNPPLASGSASTTPPLPATASAASAATDRRFALLKRTGILDGDLKGCTIGQASSANDLKQAYRLVHAVFLESGFLAPEANGIRLRLFETSPDIATFVARHEGRVVGVLSIVPDLPVLGLPSDSAFGAELDALRGRGGRLFEITNQAVAAPFRQSAVAIELMRCAIAHALEAGYDRGIASVSPSHRGFYRMIGFEDVGTERSYSDKLHDPVVAVSMDLARYRRPSAGADCVANFVHHALAKGNPYRSQVAAWARAARHAFLNAVLLVDLFVKERNFLSECSATEHACLKAHWGESLFVVVVAVHALLAAAGANPQPRTYVPLPAFIAEPGTPRTLAGLVLRLPAEEGFLARFKEGPKSAGWSAAFRPSWPIRTRLLPSAPTRPRNFPARFNHN